MGERQKPMAYRSIVDTIGNTPIIQLKSTFSQFKGTYYGKIESFNPGRSSKDRIGITIIDDAEKKGLLKEGGTIVEATSGNTGLGLALVGIERGYKVILVMPDKMSPEKMNLVKAMGCHVIVCPTEVEPDDPRSYYSVSRRIAEETPNAFYANQYFNPANPEAHYKTTGPEIWEQSNKKITHFFAGVGTGGTISGVGKYLKEMNPEIKIIGIDPKGSILAHYHKYRNQEIEARSYKVEGVGEDIIPSTVDFDVIDDFVTVNDKESFDWTRRIALKEGILLGGSSGLAAAGAAKYAQEHPDDNIYGVILFPDTGERYLGRVFSDSWLRANKFLPPPNSIADLLNAKPANLPPIISVDVNSSLMDVLAKVQKFRINQIVVMENDKKGKLLLKSTLYDAILSKTSLSMTVGDLEMEEIVEIESSLSLPNLITTLRNEKVVIVVEDGKWIGFLSKQDIIDNFPVEEI